MMTGPLLWIGCDVYTDDGFLLGRVKRIEGPNFLVNARMQPDYWLRIDHAVANSGNRLVVAFGHDHLDDERQRVEP